MRLVVVTEQAEIKNAQKNLEAAIKKGSRSIQTYLGFQGGGGETSIYWREDLQLWVDYGSVDNHYWSGYGIGNPEQSKKNPNIICEINSPLKGFNRRVAGLYVKDDDGNVYLAHSGKIGGGRKGIGKHAFRERYYPCEFASVIYPDGVEVPVIVIGKVGSPSLPRQVSRFVYEVDKIKRAVVGDPLPPCDETRFHPEFTGKKEYPLGGVVEAECYHGLVVDALVRHCLEVNLNFGKDRYSDLYILNRAKTITCLFEVKTDLTTTSVYGAIGQLMFNGALYNDSLRRVVVLPGTPNERTRTALKRLEIDMVTYEMDDDEVRFMGLNETLAYFIE